MVQHAQGLFEHAEGVFDVEPEQERLPGQVHSGGVEAGGRVPEPDRFRGRPGRAPRVSTCKRQWKHGSTRAFPLHRNRCGSDYGGIVVLCLEFKSGPRWLPPSLRCRWRVSCPERGFGPLQGVLGRRSGVATKGR